jgi:hypothetical protein
MDRANPYRPAPVRGRVVDVTHEGADAHLDTLARKDRGQDKHPWRRPGEQRVPVKIEPIHVNGSGLGR